MDSALRPREIQARIRSGESLADVAEKAGVPLERIEVYATPVLAERGHIATIAMTSSARRRGEASVHRNLRTILSERLRARGIDVESVDWDAWKLPDRRWRIEARYVDASQSAKPGRVDKTSPVVALFTFDPAGRFSVAANDEARWLLGELSTARTGDRRGRDEDGEPTIDLNDEFALVRALDRESTAEDDGFVTEAHVEHEGLAPRSYRSRSARRPSPDDELASPDRPGAAAENSPDGSPDQTSASRSSKPAKGGWRGRSRSAESDAAGPGGSPAPELEALSQPSPAVTPEDVYDVLPTPESELDALYEMLGGFNEDSVNIYAGLSEPVTEPAPQPRGGQDAASAAQDAASAAQDNPAAAPAGPSLVDPPPDDAAPDDAEDQHEPAPEPAPDAATSERDQAQAEESPSSAAASSSRPPPTQEPEQPSLIEGSGPAAARKPRANKKRASIPSWDEIMFGGPKP